MDDGVVKNKEEKTMGVTISLIIPVYNVENYLIQCMDSVIHQTILFDEVIIVNDGSTDQSLGICEKYASKYQYFKLINQENQGLSSARNQGIYEASGEYVMFLDSDDYLRLDTVKILKDKLQKIQYDAIFFDANIYCDESMLNNKTNDYDRSLAGLDGIVMDGEEYFAKCYPENYIVNVGMAIYRTQLIREKDILFPEGLYYEDNYFTFVFLEYAKSVIHISEKLHCRRYRTGSITLSEYSEKKLLDQIQIGLLIWGEILKRKDKLSLKRTELLLNYVSDYYYMVLNRYGHCKTSGVPLRKKMKIDINIIADRYFVLLNVLQLEKVKNNLFLLNKVLTNICYTNLYLEKKLDENKILCQNIVEKQKRIYYSLLKKLPLNISGYKVGIYGTGIHTKGLLMIYEKLFGKITCDLFFLDSYKSKDYFEGRKLINYKEVDSSTDLIILSSFLYEQEMLDNINSLASKISVYRFYDDIEKDIFSGYEAFLQYW